MKCGFGVFKLFAAFTGNVMDINLIRVDYAQVGATSKGCMRLIPFDAKKKKSFLAFNKVSFFEHNLKLNGFHLCFSAAFLLPFSCCC